MPSAGPIAASAPAIHEGSGCPRGATAPAVTWIVPVFNEESRLNGNVDAILGASEAHGDCELLFVDDGSTDRTAARLDERLAGHPCARLIRYRVNRGKGGAIAAGMRAARGHVVFFFDIDLSTPLDHVAPFLEAFRDPDVGVVIGTRLVAQAHIRHGQPWLRRSLGGVFRRLSGLLVPGVSDFTCGFKAFRRAVGARLFEMSLVNDWSFDTEILYLARRQGYRIVEIPVQWTHVEGSKVHMIRNGLMSLYQLVAIPLRYRLGLNRRQMRSVLPAEHD